MDLLSAIFNTVKEESSFLITNDFLSLLLQFLNQNNSMPKQYVLGMFGDIHKYIADPEGKIIQDFIRHCTLNLAYKG